MKKSTVAFFVGLGFFVSGIMFGCKQTTLDDPKDDDTPSENHPSGTELPGGNISTGGNHQEWNEPSGENSSKDPSDDDKPTIVEPVMPGSKKVLFNLEGATALATSEKESRAYYGVRSSRIARAANSNENLGILAKVLSDGSLESVIESDYDVTFPPIKYIIQSPSQMNNQLYIIFPYEVRSNGYYQYTYYDANEKIIGTNTTGEWIDGAWNSNSEWIDGELIMGRLICVYPDGTYVNILSNKDGVERNLEELEEPIVFDGYGYMYYIAYESVNNESTRIIYRYNPGTKESEQLTVGMKNYSYSKIQVSNDGQYIFVQGRNDNNSSYFLKAIPISNANSASDLIYSSDYSFSVGDWLYDEESDALYVASSTNGKEGLLKFTRDSSGYFTGTSYQNISNPMQGGNTGTEDTYPYDDNLENNMADWHCTWDNEYLDSSGKVDPKKVIESIVSYINSQMPKDNDSCYYYDIYDNNGTLVKSMVKFDYHYGQCTYYVDGIYCYIDSDGNAYDYYNCNFKQRDKEADGYKYITSSDIDIRFDNPNLKKCNSDYYNYDCKALVNDMKGLKNEEAIKALTPIKLSLLYNMTWSERYNSYSDNTYKNIFFADILYLKGTNTLLCDDPDYKYFAMSSTNNKYFAYYLSFNLVTSSKNTPTWKEEYYSGNNFNCSKVLDYFYSFSMISEDKSEYEFRLSGFENDEELDDFYSELKNEDAIDYIFSDSFLSSLFYNHFRGSIWTEQRYIPNIVRFIAKTCFVKGTDKSIITLNQESEGSQEEDNSYYPYWGNVRNLTMIKGNLWAIDNSDWNYPSLVCLIENDVYVGRIPPLLKDFRIRDIQLCGTNLYFKNIIMSSGAETGKQDIRKYDIENNIVKNLFDRLPGKDNYTVETMSIAEPNLYVCLSQGLTVSNLRIDTDTSRVEPLASSEKFKHIINFRM